jgi:hypothetical protein
MKRLLYPIANFLVSLPVSVLAQGKVEPLPNPLGVGTIPELIDRITTYIIQLAAPIVTIMILVGAFQMLTAAGNESKFSQGKKTITYAVIGMAVVLVAKGITAVITNFLGVSK